MLPTDAALNYGQLESYQVHIKIVLNFLVWKYILYSHHNNIIIQFCMYTIIIKATSDSNLLNECYFFKRFLYFLFVQQ